MNKKVGQNILIDPQRLSFAGTVFSAFAFATAAFAKKAKSPYSSKTDNSVNNTGKPRVVSSCYPSYEIKLEKSP